MAVTPFPSAVAPAAQPPSGRLPPDLTSVGQFSSAPRTAKATHHKAMLSLARGAAVGSAAGAGFGAAMGLLSPGDGMTAGYLVPIAAGIVLGGVAAVGWENLITAAPRVESPLGIVGVVMGAVLLAAITIGASSWGIATALSGPAALRAYQADVRVAEERSLFNAWTGVQTEFPIKDALGIAASEMRALSAVESRGAFTRRAGNGPATELISAAADRYDQLAESALERSDKIQGVYTRARNALQEMQQMIGADSEDFAKLAAEVQAAVSDLNGFHLTPLASQGGITRVQITTDQGAVQRIQSGADAVARKLSAQAQEIAATRRPEKVPGYVPIERRDATLRYAGTAAAGGWMTAVAIDLMPVLFIMLLLMTARERLLLRAKEEPAPGADPDFDDEPENVRSDRSVLGEPRASAANVPTESHTNDIPKSTGA
jgi:hypothetical protein